MLLSKVAKHVTIVTVHVPTEDFDVVLRAELVHTHHQVFGAARQAHLRTERKTVSSWSGFSPKSPVPDDTSGSQQISHTVLINIRLKKLQQQEKKEKQLFIWTFFLKAIFQLSCQSEKPSVLQVT